MALFVGAIFIDVLSNEPCLDNLDNLCGILLDGVHQAREDRRAVLLASVTSDVGRRIAIAVEADCGAGDEGNIFRIILRSLRS